MPRYLVKVDGKDFDIEINYQNEKYLTVVNGRETEIVCHRLGDNRAILLVDGLSLDVDVMYNGYDSNQTVFMMGQEIPVEIENYNLAQLRKTAGMSSGPKVEKTIKAPMPGLMLEIKVEVGETVAKGQPLLIIEAMKMENVIKASSGGIVKEISIAPGESVDKGQKLLEFE
jgi:biotin carboxyl carrier protein